jgi:small subunit ribosomal protein S13
MEYKTKATGSQGAFHTTRMSVREKRAARASTVNRRVEEAAQATLRSGRGDRAEHRRESRYRRAEPRTGSRERYKALMKVYGIGMHTAQWICTQGGVVKDTKVGARTRAERQVIEAWRLDHRTVGVDRRRKESEAIQRHRKRGTNRGIKRRRGLPVRGQRTSTNGMTARRLNRSRGTRRS